MIIDLTDLKQIRMIQQELHQVFDSPSGKEVMKFLEQACGWYDFSREDPDAILIAHGKRQVLATIKTLLDHPAEQVQLVAKGV
jgi:hypothetical protein